MRGNFGRCFETKMFIKISFGLLFPDTFQFCIVKSFVICFRVKYIYKLLFNVKNAFCIVNLAKEEYKLISLPCVLVFLFLRSNFCR